MNGDGYMRYDFNAIGELAGSINGRVQAIQTLVEDLRAKVDNLSSMYEGAASAGFQQTRTTWNSAADSLNAVLARIAVAVNKTNEDAQNTERLNTGRWG
ncbi:MAG TPA: WXG100 family type VII secretion target [Actinophytocola sp.]|uniref:WXG100 family type VII secretion target n=1 Tax=Actinophytocola sp. TaxID=1872138 RepID=UPI002DBF9044|nr:WXG100 family type VII secretion target [Actinophytocola sp.]HEU5472148.1 WXG100 family type VII secretion target [Actinophytocola sp.]